MTLTTQQNSTTAPATLAAVRELAPAITSRAAEIEAARRLPPDLLEQLTAAGCFRILLPPSHGGVGADLPSAMGVFETLSQADASVGWAVMIGSCSWLNIANLPRSTFDAVYVDGRDMIGAGTFNPSGTAVAVDGGYRVSGRWSFASGCEHAAWLSGNCIENVDGGQRLRTVLFYPAEVTIEDTWNVSGLRGTGSHHFRVDDVFVPAERTSDTLHDEPTLRTPHAQIPLPAFAALVTASVALGIAAGALNEILALATRKVPMLSRAPLAANPLFQFQLATADTELRAARGLLYDTAQTTWANAVAGSPLTPEQRARIRAASVWVTERAVAVVDTAYQAGGGSSLYDGSPLQRQLRDIHAVTQHFLVKPDTLTTCGAVLAGQDVDLTIF
jgi:indole-3-acetate monooxygenase